MRKVKDLSGIKFEKLTVISFYGYQTKTSEGGCLIYGLVYGIKA